MRCPKCGGLLVRENIGRNAYEFYCANCGCRPNRNAPILVVKESADMKKFRAYGRSLSVLGDR